MGEEKPTKETEQLADVVKRVSDSIAEIVKDLTAERPDVVLFSLVEVGMRILKASGKTEAESLGVMITMLTEMRASLPLGT